MRADEEAAYTEYVRGRVLAMRRTAFRLCGDWHHAHDLVQNTFVLLYRHWRRAARADSLDAYVRQMLINAFLSEQRRWWMRRVRPVGAIAEAAAANPDTDASIDVMRALARLSPGQRTVIVLRYWEGLDVAETAQALGISTGTVKSQTSYAVAALRKLLPNYVTDRMEA